MSISKNNNIFINMEPEKNIFLHFGSITKTTYMFKDKILIILQIKPYKKQTIAYSIFAYKIKDLLIESFI